MGWVVHEIRLEELQNGYIFIYFDGKRYFGNSSHKLKKNVKINVGKNIACFGGLNLFFLCNEKCWHFFC